ncbi:MAG: GGDEF domain-containing protein [Nocardioides sp.]|uniref:GGDEF domain-containing protein n=1 Tax=Nocardioides sp. TaxID=35761 RepID=UPI0039E4424A
MTELETFASSAQRVVDYLRTHTPIADWSVSRIDGIAQVHLHVSGDPGGDGFLAVGARVPWTRTFCKRMLDGAPNIVAHAALSPHYADLAHDHGVEAYAGVPIVDDDGTVFGTLCGVGVEPLDEADQIDGPLLDLFSDLLSAQLGLVRAATQERRAALVTEAVANSDPLTGLMNRRGWDLVAADARHRVDALGDHGAVLMIDLDGLKAVNDEHGHQAGDLLLGSAADALRAAGSEHHAIARLGGDEFAVYAEGVRPEQLADLLEHYRAALREAGVPGSVGAASHYPVADGDGLTIALAEADARMYADKAERRSGIRR